MAVSDTQVAGATTAAGRYPVNIRLTIPFLARPVFLTLIIGRERRGPDRLRQERRLHPLNTWGNLLTFVVTWSMFTIAALFTAFVMASL